MKNSKRSGGFRLSVGGRIDRLKPVAFRWNGAQLSAFEGDTLAAALLANGVRIVGRSFKFHRPRGLLSAGIEEPNALVTIGAGARLEPNVRATMLRVEEGLVARAQNCWPSVNFDVGRVVDGVAPLFPSGFYNKTFLWPSWNFYEGMIRRAAGLGPAPREPDPDRYEVANKHCDLLVVGGGAAGLRAARVAADAGAQVLLVEQDFELGGHLLGARAVMDGIAGADWVARAAQELRERPNVTVLTSTTAFGLYDHGVAGLVERAGTVTRERYWRVRTRGVLLATGALEQPLIFEYNDLPGVMLAGAVRQYLNRYGIAAGRRIVIATNNDSAYGAAFDLLDAGIDVPCVIDSRAEVDAVFRDALQRRGVEVLSATLPNRALGSTGLRAVRVGDVDGRARDINCDVLAMSGGWNPTAHLFCHARGRLAWDDERDVLRPVRDSVRAGLRLDVAGAVDGTTSLQAALDDGAHRAALLCASLGFTAADIPGVAVERDDLGSSRTHGPIRAVERVRTRRCWVDWQHDVTVSDLELAVREGFDSIQHLKRYTTTGMSVDQGKTSNLNALRVAAELTRQTPNAVGSTTFRPPFSPVTLGAIAGRQIGARYAPRRILPADAEHRLQAARFEEAGGWMRPAFYPRGDESATQAIHREVLANRGSVGIFDASPLGKIEVSGADAAWFLDRFYLNNVMTLESSRLRYGLMLNENGIVIDDGTIARLAPDHFLITTTSGGAGRIAHWLEEWRQCEWPDRDVIVSPVTTQWATLALSGPRAREVLSQLPTDIDLSREAFPHLQIRCGELAGVPARIYRVSFTGELSYEINVPANYGASLWRVLLEAGRNLGITPYGIEALLLMRLEKGFLHVGVDTDPTTSPADVGWGNVAMKKRADYIGKRSLTRTDNLRSERLQLVGLASDDASTLVPGAHLRLAGTREGSDGWVTSAAMSPTLRRPIALAMLRGGRARLGEKLSLLAERKRGHATVVPMAFYDPENQRVQE